MINLHLGKMISNAKFGKLQKQDTIWFLLLTGLESEQESELVDWITEAGGDIVSIEEKNEIDYLITGRASESMSCDQSEIIICICRNVP